MTEYDLDAMRAARREADEKERAVVRFGGHTFELPPEIPMEFSFSIEENDVKTAISVLFGDRAADFWEGRPTSEDVVAFFEVLAEHYRTDPGKSPPSGDSSPSTGVPSKATSGGTSGGRSAPRAGGRSRSARAK